MRRSSSREIDSTEIISTTSVVLTDIVSNTRRRDSLRELEEYESKELDIMRSERKIIREQLQSISRDLMLVVEDITVFKKATNEGLTKLRAAVTDGAADLEQETNERIAQDAKMEAELRKLREELEAEQRDRAAGDERTLRDMKKELAPILEGMDGKGRDIDNLERELKRLQDNVRQVPNQIQALEDALKQEVKDRKQAEEPILDLVKGHRESADKSLRDLGDEHHKGMKMMMDLIDREKADRNSGDDDLRKLFEELEQDVAPHAKQVPGLHTKLKDLGDLLHPQVKEHGQNLDRHKDDVAGKHKKLNQDIADLLKRLEGEQEARKGMMEEIEEMQAGFRTKVRGLLNEEGDKAKKDRDALKGGLDDLQRGQAGLGDQIKDMLQNLAAVKNGLDGALGKINTVTGRGDEAARELMALSRALEDLRNALKDGIAEEKHDFEMLFAFLEEHCTGLESLFNDLGHRLLNTGGVRQRTTTKLTTRSIVMGTPTRSEQYTSASREVTSSLTTTADRYGGGRLALDREVIMEAQASREVSSLTTTEVHVESREVRLSGSAAQEMKPRALEPPAMPEPEVKVVPKLSDTHKQKLQEILSGGRVALFADGAAPTDHVCGAEVKEFQLKLTDAIEFKKVRHGVAPLARFDNEPKAMHFLKDVVGIMELYPTSVVQIEGHTGTPPEKMDGWAQQLADNRAAMVKKTMEGLGVASNRLLAVGMPGYLGDNHSDVKFKVVKF